MTYIRDLTVLLSCTELIEGRKPDPMKPLVMYYDNGGTFTPRLLDWLIKLIKADKSQRHYLGLKTRQGRPTNGEFARDNIISECATELDGSIITNVLCKKLLSITGMSIAEPDPNKPDTHKFGWQERDDLGDWVPVTLTLKIGKLLSRQQIQRVAAAESGVSVSTVKRVLAARDAALIAGE
jgi:hypothetical protein